MSSMPDGPWQRLHIDFCGPLPTGEYLLVVIDRYSRYPEVEIVKSTNIQSVIPKLDRIFATHGIPLQVITDNGPPFNGSDFSKYMQLLGIKFTPCTPKWPQGNAEVERFNQPLMKAIQAATIEDRKWQQEIQRFLLQYHSTPHSTTEVSPAELLFNRPIQGKLPMLPNNIVDKHVGAQNNEERKKVYNQHYANARRGVKTNILKEGDVVLVKQDKRNKLTPRFNPKLYTVIERKS
ncbi:uncharacterized protein K02A2.6-like, partial [Anneissia japonica]|uniref:uncharacterized protein K02A2.6-like n=1 Tax=Anneissia japonica TaxID=1529436 RepID=UPI0014256D9E